MYIIGIDGGGTKTRIIVGDDQGHIVYNNKTKGSNIYSATEKQFIQLFEAEYANILATLKIKDEDISHVYACMSGADLEEDIAYIKNALSRVFDPTKLTVENDAWAVLRSGLKEPYGAVCIAGTGTNSACMNQKGEKAILRALSYTLGTSGGGLDIARRGFHYAFRADELTYKDTLLRTEIPKLFNKKDIEDCIPLLYPKQTITYKELGEVTPLVMKCAEQNDQVSIEILEYVAKEQALQTIGVMKQVNIQEDEEINVVVGGQVFQVKNPFIMNTFTKTIVETYKNASIIHPQYPPAVGAYLRGLDVCNIEQTDDINKNIKGSGVCYE